MEEEGLRAVGATDGERGLTWTGGNVSISDKKIKEAIKEIAKYLGLPIEVKLSYVPKGYRPGASDGFQTTHLVKTDQHNRGTGGITAQVSIPSSLPSYGSPAMINFPIDVRLSEDCTENPATLIAIMAHELSHIVLYSLHHREKENEFYTDLTAMMLGFALITKTGRKVVKTTSHTDHNFMSSRTTTTTHTTTYGYLSDDNFNFAYGRIESLLQKYKDRMKIILKKFRQSEKKLSAQKSEIVYFRSYLGYLDRNLPKKVSEQDGYWIANFHQPGYTDDLESAIKIAESELKKITASVQGLDYYSEARLENIKKYEARLDAIAADLSSKYDQVRGAVIILKKYISSGHRLKTHLKFKLNFSKNI